MSRITLAGSVTNTETDPLLPAGTRAALATTLPVQEFSVETPGCAAPVGQVLRYPRYVVEGTAVTFNE